MSLLRKALWWAVALVTTINSGADPVTWEGRVLAFLLRLVGLTVSSDTTAVLASYLLERHLPRSRPTPPDPLAALTAEVARLRESVERTVLAPGNHRPGPPDAGTLEEETAWRKRDAGEAAGGRSLRQRSDSGSTAPDAPSTPG